MVDAVEVSKKLMREYFENPRSISVYYEPVKEKPKSLLIKSMELLIKMLKKD